MRDDHQADARARRKRRRDGSRRFQIEIHRERQRLRDPVRLPANMIVAPNSPSARAQHSTAPPISAGAASGTVTKANVRSGPMPSVATPLRVAVDRAKSARAART